MNTMQKLKLQINDTMAVVPGNLIDFRIFQGSTFCHLVLAAMRHKTMAFGIDSFEGLPQASQEDLNEHNYHSHNKGSLLADEKSTQRNIDRLVKNSSNYKIIKGSLETAVEVLPPTLNISFALLDLYQYAPTKKTLKFLWETINYGGCIFVQNYNKSNTYASNLAITQFIEDHVNEIEFSVPLITNGIKEDFISIKCFNNIKKSSDWIKYIPVKKNLSVALVLKSGGVYDYNYVNALANGLRKHSTLDFEIVCLTDNSHGFNSNIDRVVHFTHDYPKWWGKIELFRPDIFSQDQRVIFIDLDTIIVNNIDEILKFEVEFSGLRDFYTMDSLGSGVMAWTPSDALSKIYSTFVVHAQRIIDTYPGGDQKWIDETKPSIVYIQDMYPNQIVSYKKHCIKKNNINIPTNARIVCFHGVPKPHTITDTAIKMHWNP